MANQSTYSQESSSARQRAIVCILVLSIVGVIVGGIQTYDKFIMEFTCRDPSAGICPATEVTTCVPALMSEWSALFGVPLSVYAIGFYSTTLILAVRLLRWSKRQRRSRAAASLVLLLVLGVFAVLLSAALAIFSITSLESLCPLCTFLYFVNIMLFASVALAHGGVSIAGWRTRVRTMISHAPALLDVLFLAGYIFVGATGVPALAFRLGGHFADAECPSPVDGSAPLPASNIRYNADDADILISAFLDPTCPYCRREFLQMMKFVEEQDYPYKVGLVIYHFPREIGGRCVPEVEGAPFPSGGGNGACDASSAVECVERLAPGKGVKMLDGVFNNLQQGYRNPFARKRLIARAAEIGVPAEPLVDCMDNDSEVSATIKAHMMHLLKDDIVDVPLYYLTPVINGELSLADGTIVPGYKSRLTLERYVRRIARSLHKNRKQAT